MNTNTAAATSMLPAVFSNAVMLYNGKPQTTSLKVADIFGKQHKNVIQSIELMEMPSDFNTLNFQRISYHDNRNRLQKMYNMTKDGFTLLAMGFTGAKAMQFKIAYIEAFNKMEAELRQKPCAVAPSMIDAANDWRDFNASALRAIIFRLLPEHRGTGSLSHCGRKAEIIRALTLRGLRPASLSGLKALPAPEENAEPIYTISGVASGVLGIEPETLFKFLKRRRILRPETLYPDSLWFVMPKWTDKGLFTRDPLGELGGGRIGLTAKGRDYIVALYHSA
ncbi:MAG: Rha family transcriptional regulator [Lentisphaerota bacterium]